MQTPEPPSSVPLRSGPERMYAVPLAQRDGIRSRVDEVSDGGGERLLEDVETLAEQLVARGERRQEPEDVAVRAARQGDETLGVAGLVDGAGQRGVGREVARAVDELDREHGAATADVADLRVLLGERLEARHEEGLDLLGAAAEVLLLHRLDGTECGRTGDRVAAVGAAEAAGVDRVHDVRAAGDDGQREPAGNAPGC